MPPIVTQMFICVMLLATIFFSPSAMAAPRDNGSVGHLASGPNEKLEKNSYVLSLKLVNAKIASVLNGTQAVISGDALQHSTGSAEVEEFRKFLLNKPYKELSYGLAIAQGEEPNREEIVQIFLMLRNLGQDFYPPMFRLINIVKTGEYAKRAEAIIKSERFLSDSWIDFFKRFDRAWFEFLSNVDKIDKNKVTNVTQAEIFKLSGLGKYLRKDFTMQGHFDRMLRALDAHLYALRDEVLKKLQDDKLTLAKYHDTAAQALSKVKEHITGYSFYAKVDPVVRNFEKILDQIKELETMIDVCLDDAYSNTRMLGRLRKMKNFDPYGSLHVSHQSINNGCPIYYDRVLTSIESARRHYHSVLKRIEK